MVTSLPSRMTSDSGETKFVLKEIYPADRKELARGAYGKIYTVNFRGKACAAKEINCFIIEDLEET